MTLFRKLLIANRGEIAMRVLRTCRELGIPVVAVYSTEDRDSAVVRAADEAVAIGPAAPRHSYLNLAAVVEAALQTGADALHPGYGFLSEDADLAEVCAQHGVTFIGPPAAVIANLGDKTAARATMRRAGVPMLPGSFDPLRDATEAAAAAAEAGYPVIIKAAAGGGGRGMTVVDSPADFAAAYAATTAAARQLFGDDRVYVEHYLRQARHIEVQILCDRYGGAVHLGERDCSVQRRRQKLVEESPAPGLEPALRDRICAAAVRGALAAGYVGAGTFEFLLAPDGRFFFMEVNCRIQVEHPVTEMVTGVDLVREQLLVAAGEPLRLRQEDVRTTGAAMECRINAEDPDRGFAPAPGRLHELRLPAGPFVRVDSHLEAGMHVSPAYDSLLAKVIAWAPDREQALARIRRALEELHVAGPGVATTRDFLLRVTADPEFVPARHDTSLVDRLCGG